MTDVAVTLVVGLGNPGDRYAANRHNVGFRVVEELARRLDLAFTEGAPSYTAAAGARHDVPLVLLKPLTYMNLSGEALDAWSDRHGVPLTAEPAPEDAEEAPETPPGPPPARILVVCDDLSLPLGSVRLRGKGSSGGQNGLGSIIEHLDTEAVPRLRLGIAPLDAPVDPADWPDYVLADFTAEEADPVTELVERAADAVLCWLDEGLEVAVSRFNRRIRPPADE